MRAHRTPASPKTCRRSHPRAATGGRRGHVFTSFEVWQRAVRCVRVLPHNADDGRPAGRGGDRDGLGSPRRARRISVPHVGAGPPAGGGGGDRRGGPGSKTRAARKGAARGKPRRGGSNPLTRNADFL